MNLKPETLDKIEDLILRYPQKRSAALPLLHLVQEEQGFIAKEAVEWIAAKLDLQPIAIHELLTFYPMLREQPIGRKHVKVCRTLSCALAGSYKLCDKLQEDLHCKLGETSADGEYTLEFVECLAKCDTAPIVQVNEVLYENVTPDKAEAFAAQLRDSLGAARSEAVAE